MYRLLLILFLLPLATQAQRRVPVGSPNAIDTNYIAGNIHVAHAVRFPQYATANTNQVLGFDANGNAVLRTVEPAVTAGTTTDYYRGDKTWQAISSLPISTATQTALNTKVTISGDAPASPLRYGTTNSQPLVGITNNITRDSIAANGAITVFSPLTNGFEFFSGRSLSNELLFKWVYNTADVKQFIGIDEPRSIATAVAKSSGSSTVTYPSSTRHSSAGLYGLFPTGTLILGPANNQTIQMRTGGEAGTLRFQMHTDGKMGVGGSAGTNGGVNQWQVSDGLKTDGLTVGYAAKTANYTATNNDYFLAVDATAGDVTIALPTTGIIAGKIFEVFKTNITNNVILDPAGSVTINGAATATLSSQYQHYTVIWTGTEYLKK